MSLTTPTIIDLRIKFELTSLELGKFLLMVNIFGPYEGKVAYW